MPIISKGLAAMLARDLGRDADDDNEPVEHPIDPRAQAMELRERYLNATTPYEFLPGMLCREKRGLSIFRTARLLLFWRLLDVERLADDRRLVKNTRKRRQCLGLDCLVGNIDHDGDFTLLPYESWRLEPCDQEFPDD